MPNLAFNWVWALIVALVMASGATVFLGPVIRAITERRQIIAGWTTVFIVVFLLAILIKPPRASPELIAEVPQIIIGGVSKANTPPTTSILLIIDLLNRGDLASVVRDFNLEATIDNRESYMGRIEQLPETLDLPMDNGKTVTVHARDAIYSRVLYPIPPGGEVPGVLWVWFENTDLGMFKNHVLNLTLFFDDVLGKHYTYNVPIKSNIANPKYYPGLSLSVH